MWFIENRDKKKLSLWSLFIVLADMLYEYMTYPVSPKCKLTLM